MQYGDYLYYKQIDEDEDGTYDYVEITDCDESVTKIEIPGEIDGLPVKSIKYEAFQWCDSLTSIEIPDSVTSIGEEAFKYCDSLTSIEIPDSVTSIGDSAFYCCESLTSITIENPECDIYDKASTISNGYDNGYYFNGTIYGYENSTAQEYADKYERNFVSLGEKPVVTTPAVTTAITTTQTTATTTTVETTKAQETTAGTTTIPTVTTAVTTTTVTENVKGDSNGDGVLNIRDAAFIARKLVENKVSELPDWADYNGDGTVNIRDAAAIARYLTNKHIA